jgi:RNA polymerase sigma-70 factor (ECF subfamily)
VGVPATGNDAFKQAALEHIDALYGYAVSLTRDRIAAEDLVQETYLRAVRAFGRLEPDSNLKGWLFAIMRNVWLNELRHARSGPRFVALQADGEVSAMRARGVAADPYRAYTAKEAGDDVRDAIGRLPDRYREVVVLRDIEGFSYQQIAAILGCPAGTVMSRLGRARERLRVLLVAWRAGAAS